MEREVREGLLAVVIAIVGFVVPVSIGFAWREPITPERPHARLALEGVLPADGVLRFSSVDDRGRGNWPDECVQWELRPADPSIPRRELFERFSFLVESASATPCAERMPYEEEARCEQEWTTRMRLADGRRVAVAMRTVSRYYDLEDWDRERCARAEGARWVEVER